MSNLAESARNGSKMGVLAQRLEDLYHSYNDRKYVWPDPLHVLYDYPDVRDREIVGLIASSLAFGNVKQIMRSIERVLERMPHPRAFVESTTEADVRGLFRDFRHRFVTGDNLAELLSATRRVLTVHGSLGACVVARGKEPEGSQVYRLTEALRAQGVSLHNFLVPDPARGSACKRINLYFRWMVRRDAVDPGGWHGISARDLVIPLDTHMFRLGTALGLTRRRSANVKTALEITEAFRAFAPEDPVRYDFALTRLGIRADGDEGGFLRAAASP